MSENNLRYLGDGVYASFDGYHVILDLRGQDNTTRIALDASVRWALKQYMDDLFAGEAETGGAE